MFRKLRSLMIADTFGSKFTAQVTALVTVLTTTSWGKSGELVLLVLM
jgi:hypothetical protein